MGNRKPREVLYSMQLSVGGHMYRCVTHGVSRWRDAKSEEFCPVENEATAWKLLLDRFSSKNFAKFCQ
jgi:hypothetical protein